jgi:hypothetical protein
VNSILNPLQILIFKVLYGLFSDESQEDEVPGENMNHLISWSICFFIPVSMMALSMSLAPLSACI